MARNMKDSGIEWIGEIPEGWEISKVSYFYEVQLGKMLQPQKKSETDTEEKYLCAANVGKNSLSLDTLKTMWFSQTEKHQFDLKEGDLLVVEGGDVASCAIIETPVRNLFFQNALHRVRPLHNESVAFLRYWLMTAKSYGYIDLICNKATIAHFSKEKFIALPIPVIPQDIQSKIVSFLDLECKQIDDLLSKSRSSIEEYKKLKQAVITQAVTKGVRGEREMKPTDFTRWSEIPFDWNLKRVKSCIASISSGLSAVTDDANSEESGKFVLRTSAVSSGFFVPTEVKPVLKSAVNRLICPVEPDTLIVSRMNTASMVGACAYVANNHPNTFLPDKLWKIKFLPSYHTKYMWYALNSVPAKSWFSELATGASSSMQNISINDFTSNYLPIPAFSEQKEIANYLDAKCAEIDKLIAKKEQLVKELESYKKSLIYEVVTGKREV